MSEYVKLPDGKYMEIKEGMTDNDISDILSSYNKGPEKEDSFMDAAGRVASDYLSPLKGAARTAANIGNLALNAPRYAEEALFTGPSRVFGEVDLNKYLPFQKPTTTKEKILESLPELAGSMVLPAARLGRLSEALGSIPKFGKYLTPAIEQAASQGLYSAATSPEDRTEKGLESAAITAPLMALSQATAQGSPFTKMLGKSLMALGGAGAGGYGGYQAGGTMGALGGAAAGALGGYKLGNLSPERRLASDVLKGVEGTGYKESLDAAKRLGLTYLTPAEASGSVYAGVTQGGIGKTEKGLDLLAKKGAERLQSEKKAINKLFDTVYNKDELGKLKNTLYDISGGVRFKEEAINSLKQDENIKRAIQTVEKDPAFKEALKGVDKNSIKYFDEVKRAIRDKADAAMAKGKSGKSSNIIKSEKKLIDEMDKISPLYKEARGLAERDIARQNLEKFFDKKEMTGTNFAKYLQSDKKVEDLMKHLRTVPEAQQQVKDMRRIFDKLINVPTAKKAEALKRTSMSEARSGPQAWKTELKEIISGGKYDKAAVELITNPSWEKDLHKLSQISSPEKITSSLLDMLGRASSNLPKYAEEINP